MKTIVISSLAIFLLLACSPSHRRNSNQTILTQESQVDSIDRETIDSLKRFQDQALNDLKKSTDVVLICGDSMLALFEKVEGGNVMALRTFIRNGGSPLFQCYDNTRPVAFLRSLSNHVMWSESFELVEYYVSLQINQETLDSFLEYYCEDQKYDRFTKLIIKKGGRISSYSHICYPIQKDLLKRLVNLGYDVNGVDQNGNTDFMHYSECPCPDGSDKVLESMKFLKSLGADHTIKNNEGKTALDLATNNGIKNFIKSL